MVNIDLSGKIAVVTGGSGELGRVMVRTLAAAGADVAIHYHRNFDKAQELLAEIRKMGRRGAVVQADITRESDVLAMRHRITQEIGDADIIVNNSVIQYEWKTVLDQSPEDYESQFRSCVLHNVLMSKAFVPAMIRKRWGRVIGINTECAMQVAPTQSAYVSGKGGMDRMLRVLAKEVGEFGVTVNQVAPGWMISDKYRAAHQESQPHYEKNVPLRHRGTDQDVANAVAFLASDLAAFITGAYVPVCGGNVMPCI
jgi:3-oxoacyl-[acyl-carrier protein] reductase